MGIWDQQLYTQPWKEMNKLLHEMGDLFESPFFGRSMLGKKGEEFPPVNMSSNESEVILKAEIPGINPEEINIQVLEDVVSFQGERKSPTLNREGKQADYHRQERFMGKFSRTFKMPFPIQADKVEAKYENGVLQISLPRSEKDKPKPIKVKIS